MLRAEERRITLVVQQQAPIWPTDTALDPGLGLPCQTPGQGLLPSGWLCRTTSTDLLPLASDHRITHPISHPAPRRAGLRSVMPNILRRDTPKSESGCTERHPSRNRKYFMRKIVILKKYFQPSPSGPLGWLNCTREDQASAEKYFNPTQLCI